MVGQCEEYSRIGWWARVRNTIGWDGGTGLGVQKHMMVGTR